MKDYFAMKKRQNVRYKNETTSRTQNAITIQNTYRFTSKMQL